MIAGRPSPRVLAAAPSLPDASPPRFVSVTGELAIVAASVPGAIYDKGTLDSRLADVEWVSRAGAAHHAVIEAVAEGYDVLPLRFMTLFSTEARALSTFKRSQARIERALERVKGRAEWVLRVGKPDPARLQPASGDAADSGAAFLRAKAAAKRRRQDAAQRVAADTTRLLEALEEVADESTTRPVEAGANLLLDAALLVSKRRVDRLQKTLTDNAAGLVAAGCSVSLTGPWPPYSFAAVGES